MHGAEPLRGQALGHVCALRRADVGSPVLPGASGRTFTGEGNRLCHAAQRTGPEAREEVAGEKARAPGNPILEGHSREKQRAPILRGHRAAGPTRVHLSLVCRSAGVPMLSVQPKGKQKGCAGCNRKIKDRYLLKALDKYWHEDCLKCACCDCRLGEVGSTLYTKANLILCRRDYLRWAASHRLALLLREPLAVDPVPRVHSLSVCSSRTVPPLPLPCSPTCPWSPHGRATPLTPGAQGPAQVPGRHL